MTTDSDRAPGPTRRQLLAGAAGTVAAAALSGCTRGSRPAATAVLADSAHVAAAERRRRAPNATLVPVRLTAQQSEVDLGGLTVRTWTYGGTIPGPTLRVRRGDVLQVRLDNQLPDPTTIHWHGVALRNDMDGVPDLTQPAVQAGRQFGYEFTVPDAGTYWFRPHVGTQLDRGLYAPLIVDDPRDPGRYDAEFVIVLDDWLDGTGGTPDSVLKDLRAMGMAGMGSGMPGMPGMGGEQSPLFGDAGDVDYPHYLLNGRLPTAPVTFTARPRQRVRLRVINAAADTAFRVALGGHRMTVTHTDGFPVRPAVTDALLISIGERYDVTVTAGDGVFPLVAVAEGKGGQALAVLRTGAGRPPAAGARPAELNRKIAMLADLTAAEDVQLPAKQPDRIHTLRLGMGMSGYRWTINDRTYGEDPPLRTSAGERVRLEFVNSSPMFHPMHLHGHTFAVRGRDGQGPRKDTVMVWPNKRITVDLAADNPGQWLTHCHNVYHGEAGMMARLSYVE